MTEATGDNNSSDTTLSSWIERILFIANLLIGAMGSVLIFRYRKIAVDTFEDFGVELPALTEFALTPLFSCFIPILTAAAFASHFLPTRTKLKTAVQAGIFAAMLIVAGLFVITTVPAMYRLIESLG